jgi:hypothetical protein
MSTIKRKLISLLVAGAVLLLIGSAALGAGEGYILDWWTVDGGGGTSTGGQYSLSGAVGQPDPGKLSGGGYALVGGFWTGGASIEYHIYLPLAEK